MKPKYSRIRIPDDLWNLLSKLTDNARMDWFYDEFIGRKTISKECLDDASCAFNASNLYNFNNGEVLRLYELFTKYDVVDDLMREELVVFFRTQPNKKED